MKKKIALALAAIMTFSAALPMNLFAATDARSSLVIPSGYRAADDKGQLTPGGNTQLPAGTLVNRAKVAGVNQAESYGEQPASLQGQNIVVQFQSNATIGSFQIELSGAKFAYLKDTGLFSNYGATTTYGDWFTSTDPTTALRTGYYEALEDVYRLKTERATLEQITAAYVSKAIADVVAAAQAVETANAGVGGSPITVANNTKLNAFTGGPSTSALLTGIANALINTDVAAATGISLSPFITGSWSPDIIDLTARVNSFAVNKSAIAAGLAKYLNSKAWDATADDMDDVLTACTAFFSDENLVAYNIGTNPFQYYYDLAVIEIANDANKDNYRDEAVAYFYSAGFANPYANSKPIDFKIVPLHDNVIQVEYRGDVKINDFMVIPVPFINTSENPVVATIKNSDNGVVTPMEVSLASRGGTGSTLTAGTVAIGNYRIYLPKLTISEVVPGTVKSNGAITFQAPDGYVFSEVHDNPTASVANGVRTNGSALSVNASYPNGGREITLSVKNISDADRWTIGQLNIEGLVIVPINPDNTQYNQELKIKVLDRDDRYGVPKDTEVPVAKRAIWEVNVVGNDAKTFAAGWTGSEAGYVTVNETTESSWWTRKETTYTVVVKDEDGNFVPTDAVKIDQIKVWTSDNVTPKWTDSGDPHTVTGNETNFIFARDMSSVTLADFITNTGAVGTINVRFYFSVNPNFTGNVEGEDIYIAVTNNQDVFAQSYNEENTVKVATARPNTVVTVGKTDVAVGYQRISISNIKLEEVKAGDWDNKSVLISIGEYGTGNRSNYMYFGALSRDKVYVENSTTTALTISNVALVDSNRTLQFNIDRKSNYVTSDRKKVDPAVIVVEGVTINASHDVPFGEFDLLVGGTALMNNTDVATYLTAYSNKFPVYGYVTPSVVKVTEGTAFNDVVDVYINGSGKVVVNADTDAEKEYVVDEPAPFIDEDTDRTMVPIRFIAEILGANSTEQVVYWDEVARTCTVKLYGKTVVFTDGSAQLKVDNITFTTYNDDGTAVVPKIDEASNRFVIPFRALGEALGIQVDASNFDDGNGYVSYLPAAK